MSYVSSVFTEYERKVLREIAVHRIQPNAVQRLLEGAGKPFSRLLNLGRSSNNRAVRGLSDHVRGWIEEGLIKTFKAANKLTNTRDVQKRFLARGIHVDSIESLRYLPLSQLDQVANSYKFSGSFLLAAEGAILWAERQLLQKVYREPSS